MEELVNVEWLLSNIVMTLVKTGFLPVQAFVIVPLLPLYGCEKKAAPHATPPKPADSTTPRLLAASSSSLWNDTKKANSICRLKAEPRSELSAEFDQVVT